MSLHRLRRVLLFVDKCIDGKYPEYLNDSFVVNRESNSRKMNMLVQSKFKCKYGHICIRYQGARLWNGVDNEFKLATNFNEWSLECRGSYCDMCVLKTLLNYMYTYDHHFVNISSSCRRIALWLMLSVEPGWKVDRQILCEGTLPLLMFQKTRARNMPKRVGPVHILAWPYSSCRRCWTYCLRIGSLTLCRREKIWRGYEVLEGKQSLDQVKSLSQVYGSHAEGLVLFSAFLLKLPEGEYHVYCGAFCLEATLRHGLDAISKFLETY